MIDALREADPLTARARFPDLDPELVRDALTQAKHRPPDFPLPLVTADGVQMSTPVPVAIRRAQRLAEQGVQQIVDAGCGIGIDAWAFHRAGLQVVAFEVDPATAQIAAANLTGTGVEVINEDVTTADLPPGAVFVDPARRRHRRDASGNPLRVNDPAQWNPPWGWVEQLSTARPVVARVRPGMREIPDDTEWQCTSMGHRLVDATVWFPPLAVIGRRACVAHGDSWHEITGPACSAPVGPPGRYIVDPDPAIVRAGLVGNLADRLEGRLLDEHLAFVTCDDLPPGWAGRAMEVECEVSRRDLADRAQELGIAAVTVWARGFEHSPAVGLPEGPGGILVAARVGSPRRTKYWIGHPVGR